MIRKSNVGAQLKVFLMAATAVASACAQATSSIGEVQDRWHVVISPYLWAGSLNGSTSLANYAPPVHVPFSQIFQNLDLALMGQIEMTNGKYGVFVDGEYVATSKGLSVEGVPINLGMRSTMLNVGGYVRAFQYATGGDTVFGGRQELTVSPTFGLRWTQLRAWVDPVASNHTANWIDPVIGVRVSYDLNDRWNLFSEADIGGFGMGSRFSANAQAYFGYRTHVFGKPTIVRVGYRVWYQDFANDKSGYENFAWKVTQHGPVVGLSMTF